MALISITIPDAQLTRVVSAVCVAYGYQAIIGYTGTPPNQTPVPNPETKAQFAKRMLVEHLRKVVKQVEGSAAAQAAAQQVADEVDGLGIS